MRLIVLPAPLARLDISSLLEFIFILFFGLLTYMCLHLQNMYEEGDEEMKKTIVKAWTDARSGKAADPLQSYR